MLKYFIADHQIKRIRCIRKFINIALFNFHLRMKSFCKFESFIHIFNTFKSFTNMIFTKHF